jgi:hypothetical protein
MIGADASPSARHLVLRASVALPGLYAWVTTVALPVAERQASAAARAAAYAALGALVVGVLLGLEHRRWARAVGGLGFVGLCVLSWILLGPLIDVGRLHPVRAACGGAGWALYAIGWGSAHPSRMAAAAAEEPAGGSRLAARERLPRGAVAVLSIGIVGALLPWFSAWTVTRPEHAVLAHAVARVVAVLVVSAAANVALERERRLPLGRPRSRLRAAGRPLSALAFALAAGLIWWVLY